MFLLSPFSSKTNQNKNSDALRQTAKEILDKVEDGELRDTKVQPFETLFSAAEVENQKLKIKLYNRNVASIFA